MYTSITLYTQKKEFLLATIYVVGDGKTEINITQFRKFKGFVFV